MYLANHKKCWYWMYRKLTDDIFVFCKNRQLCNIFPTHTGPFNNLGHSRFICPPSNPTISLWLQCGAKIKCFIKSEMPLNAIQAPFRLSPQCNYEKTLIKTVLFLGGRVENHLVELKQHCTACVRARRGLQMVWLSLCTGGSYTALHNESGLVKNMSTSSW